MLPPRALPSWRFAVLGATTNFSDATLDRRLQIPDEAQQQRARQERHERRHQAITQTGDLDPLIVLPRVVSHSRDAHRRHWCAGSTEPRLAGDLDRTALQTALSTPDAAGIARRRQTADEQARSFFEAHRSRAD